MTQTRHRNKLVSAVTKSHHCLKAPCPSSMPSQHPTWYTNGLCERHFFEMDLLSHDHVDHNSNKKPNLLSKERKIDAGNHRYQPLRDDIRQTCEMFDGRQWRIIEQKIDHSSRTTNNDHLELVTRKTDIENDLLQIFQLIKNYQTIKDELKKQDEQTN